jgi:hypothetical protein
MSFFCLLWVPLFYFLRRSFLGGGSLSGGVWALLLGSIVAIVQFFLGYIIHPGGFGLSRIIFGFVEIISLPVLIPLFIYFLMILFRGFSGDIDFTNFALLWLIPIAALRSLSWSSLNDPILLILVPLLWTALAAGIPFFIHWMMDSFHVLKLLLSVVCIAALPVAAAATYWAFFSQQTLLGFALLAVTHIPFGFSVAFDISRS